MLFLFLYCSGFLPSDQEFAFKSQVQLSGSHVESSLFKSSYVQVKSQGLI